jgi:hypothetical protein
MTKFVAQLALLVAGLALTLGNYWYTFGLWPRSWVSFVGFGIGAFVLFVLRELVEKDQ